MDGLLIVATIFGLTLALVALDYWWMCRDSSAEPPGLPWEIEWDDE